MSFLEEQLNLLDEMVSDYELINSSFGFPEFKANDNDLSGVFNYIDTMSFEDYVNSVPQF